MKPSIATKTASIAAKTLVALALAATAGCASTTTQTAQGPEHWERRTIANGVELSVSDEAGPEARRIAEQIQSEMQSRYISARQ